MQGQVQYQIQWPRPGRALLGIIIANVVAYILQLVLLRANVQWVSMLYLSPRDVFVDGYVWQVVTYWWLHSPMHPSHLLFNMLMLWLFGTRMESRWGQKRFLLGYFLLGLGGSVLVLLVGLVSLTEAFRPLLGSYWVSEHLGASGAATGLIVAWGLTFAEQEFNFLLLGRMKGKTLVIIIVAIEMLVALSFSNTSSASHFGGMIAAFVMVRGLWRPSRWKDWMHRQRLKAKRRNIEHQLRVLEGGNGGEQKEASKPDPDDPKNWN